MRKFGESQNKLFVLREARTGGGLAQQRASSSTFAQLVAKAQALKKLVKTLALRMGVARKTELALGRRRTRRARFDSGTGGADLSWVDKPTETTTREELDDDNLASRSSAEIDPTTTPQISRRTEPSESSGATSGASPSLGPSPSDVPSEDSSISKSSA